ncbi:MAG: MerR family transcriptional regulator [Thermoleophilia bacterium]
MTHTPLTVGRLAALTGVSPRTLHHYDRIGLLRPHHRTPSGYRVYGAAEVARLREILVWRRMGIPLARVAELVAAGAGDRRGVLEDQLRLVRARTRELEAVAHALQLALDEEDAGMATDERVIAALDGFDPADHARETRERWGDTAAYRTATRRAARRRPEEWAAMRAEATAIEDAMAALWRAGAPADGPAAAAQAEEWRRHISRHHYACTTVMLATLGEMYVADPRFTAHYDGADGSRAGFAAWVRDALVARASSGHAPS